MSTLLAPKRITQLDLVCSPKLSSLLDEVDVTEWVTFSEKPVQSLSGHQSCLPPSKIFVCGLSFSQPQSDFEGFSSKSTSQQGVKTPYALHDPD